MYNIMHLFFTYTVKIIFAEKSQVIGSNDYSAHVYEEVGENTETKIYNEKDVPVNERYSEIGSIAVNMNECVVYAVIKT